MSGLSTSSEILKSLAKRASVRVFSAPVLRRVPYALEVLGCGLQSKRGGGFRSEWQETTNAAQFIHRDDPVIFDVGANVGGWTNEMLRRLHGSPRIVMFEPQPQCWSCLQGMLDANVTLQKTAVGDQDGTIEFYQESASEFGSVYVRNDFPGAMERIEVPCIRLDRFIEMGGYPMVDFVKLDIEGHEMKAIKGAETSLRNGKICAISFEFGSPAANSRTFFIDFFEFMSSIQLSIYRLGHDGIPVLIPRYTRALEYFDGVSNYVATAKPPKRFRSA